MGSPFRIEPALPVTAVKTYQITNPMRPATCEEVECAEHLNGWRLRVEALSAQDVHVATHCGRRYRKVSITEGETWLVFEAGQPCFRSTLHRLPWDGRERFFERGGDWRGQTSPRVEHTSDGWLDSFGEHQDRLKAAVERG